MLCISLLVSPNRVYSKNSFKNFDYILSPNNLISSQLKYLTKNSKILTIGYPLLNEKINKNSQLENLF